MLVPIGAYELLAMYGAQAAVIVGVIILGHCIHWARSGRTSAQARLPRQFTLLGLLKVILVAGVLFALLRDPPDLVFNFAEGTGVSRSREARVPAVCELLGIPCTGSDPLGLAVALDKDAKRLLADRAGVGLKALEQVTIALRAEIAGVKERDEGLGSCQEPFGGHGWRPADDDC